MAGSESKVIKVCSLCGSESVAADAAARWNVEAQQWEVSNVFDDGHSCNDCGNECQIVDRPEPVDVDGALDAWVNEVPIGIDEAHRRLAVRNAVAELVEAASEVRAAHRELPSTGHPAEVRRQGEARIGRAHYALEAALFAVRGGAPV